MPSNIKATHFFFCFHPRFDTGTWTIATAFASLLIFAALFVLTLAYSFPTCACPVFYDHLTILPPVIKVVYAATVLFFALFIVCSLFAIFGTFKAQHNKLPPYIILLVVTEVSVFVGSIFVFILLARFEEYLLFDNETYINMARLIVKEEVFRELEVIVGSLSTLLLKILNLSLEEVLNVDKLMDAALKLEVITVLGGMKQMMKVSVSLIMVGFNAFLITAVLTACSHYYRLKNEVTTKITGLPGMDSIKSPPSDTLSDRSGIPMTQLLRTRSHGNYPSTARNSARIYSELSRNGSGKYRKGDVYTRSSHRPYEHTNGRAHKQDNGDFL